MASRRLNGSGHWNPTTGRNCKFVRGEKRANAMVVAATNPTLRHCPHHALLSINFSSAATFLTIETSCQALPARCESGSRRGSRERPGQDDSPRKGPDSAATGVGAHGSSAASLAMARIDRAARTKADVSGTFPPRVETTSAVRSASDSCPGARRRRRRSPRTSAPHPISARAPKWRRSAPGPFSSRSRRSPASCVS